MRILCQAISEEAKTNSLAGPSAGQSAKRYTIETDRITWTYRLALVLLPSAASYISSCTKVWIASTRDCIMSIPFASKSSATKAPR